MLIFFDLKKKRAPFQKFIYRKKSIMKKKANKKKTIQSLNYNIKKEEISNLLLSLEASIFNIIKI